MIQSLQEAHNKELREGRIALTDALVNGDAGSYDEYKFIVGQIRGLVMAEVYFNDMIAKMRNDEEDKRE